jgi:putative molybdopterin biosynthesis protein
VLLEYHLRRLGIAPESVQGYEHEEPTHLAVAVAVADGRADCGLGVPHAAANLGLAFVPLFAERFDLVISRTAYEGERLRPLVALLKTRPPGFVAQVEALGGYTTQGMGQVLGEW